MSTPATMRGDHASKMGPLGEAPAASVYSSSRNIVQPPIDLPDHLPINTRLKMDGQHLLSDLPANAFPIVFFDPQYRGVLDHLSYGNEGASRERRRVALPQMTDIIPGFIRSIDRILLASGHLFLWVDKFHLCQGIHDWLSGTSLEIVDMITWDKQKIGMGYRSRRRCEYLLVLQKSPRKAKGVWQVHNIADVWQESVVRKRNGVHPKPVKLQAALIEAVSNPGDVVVDPAAGSFSVMEACRIRGRNFVGCDING